MTVSRVINADPRVRPQTRETVKLAIAALRYVPNPAARNLAGAAHLRIALLFSNPSASYLSEFLVGSLDQAGRSDVQLLVEKCEIGTSERDVTERLVRTGIDGVILPPPLCDSAVVRDLLLAARIPIVVVATADPPATAASVSIDDLTAARVMANHLASLGHRRIGFITGHPNQTTSARRLAGYRAALTDHALSYSPDLVMHGTFDYRSGMAAADRLLALATPPSAIFASNDDMAAATVAVAHRRGLDVPGDLTVCGFDDSALATTIWPELTTIRQPIADMSRAAVELLVETIRMAKAGRSAKPAAPAPARHIVLDFTLIRRESDAAPPHPPEAP